MKILNIGSIRKAKQKGFTIIELVVVILLLGILTATALPRFMDISDEAHGAVVDAVEGSLRTGMALFHAQWLAEGQPTTGITYDGGTLHPSADITGYPSSTDGTYSDSADCLAVFNGLLTLGGMTIASVDTDSTSAATAEAAVEGAVGANDWVATELVDTPSDCIFYYTGQFQSGTSTANAIIPTLTYDISAGSITRGSITWVVD
ncbi:MAG: hypothetical protein COA96_11005 [SAR86 cluster bacterium]|uniref:Prepilin-type cleavage/methylation domain-containing protein n=1 Tax=SAR86 cluster bacterium TaxID=2030880 RepID=A0A2A5AWZ9_9GAMM|nr:MAG: hypothetical protein COA96_11005 [SAR86 cluster bacterium]